LGLLKGASEFFNDPIEIEILDQGSSSSGSFVEVKVRSTKPYGKTISLKSYRALSLWTLKDFITTYTIIFPVFTFVATFLLTKFFGPLIGATLTSILALIGVMFGLKDFRKGLDGLKRD